MLSWESTNGEAPVRLVAPSCEWNSFWIVGIRAVRLIVGRVYGWTGWQSPRWLRGSQQSGVLKQSWPMLLFCSCHQ